MEENDISVTWSTSNVVHREEKSQKGITIFKESLVLHMSVFTINSIFKLLFNLCSSFFIYVIFSPKKFFLLTEFLLPVCDFFLSLRLQFLYKSNKRKIKKLKPTVWRKSSFLCSPLSPSTTCPLTSFNVSKETKERFRATATFVYLNDGLWVQMQGLNCNHFKNCTKKNKKKSCELCVIYHNRSAHIYI